MSKHILIAIALVMGCHYERPFVDPAPLAPDPNMTVPYARQLGDLIEAWHGAQSDHNSRWNADDIVTEIHDAYEAACAAEHRETDMWRYDRNSAAPVGFASSLMDLDSVYAVFEQAPDGHFADAMKHIDTARRRLRQLLLIKERIGLEVETLDTWPYIALERELWKASALLDTAPPSEMPWDVKSTLAHIEGAIAVIENANLEPQKERVRYHDPRPTADSTRGVQYRERLLIARDILDRAGKDLEADPSPAVRRGPRAQVMVHVHAIVAALNGVLGAKVVSAARDAAPRR